MGKDEATIPTKGRKEMKNEDFAGRGAVQSPTLKLSLAESK